MARAAGSTEPERLEDILSNAATAAGQLSPEVMLELLTERYQSQPGDQMDVIGAMVDRMSDATIAGFVATSVVTERGATARLAQAFQALVPEGDRRDLLVDLAESEVLKTPLGRETSFEDLWKRASELLLSYRDETFVSADYARELTTARTQAMDVERVSDDPPERIAAWLATVTDAEVRHLDLLLLLDLLRVEDDPARWADVLEPVVAHVNDLVLLGDLECAVPLVSEHCRGCRGRPAGPNAARLATAAIGRLATGHLMTSLVGHLRTVDDSVSDHAKALCHALGRPVIKPLAEALAAEERGRAFRRLTDILVSFGSRGRDAVEQLKNSPNPAVRRTAIHLLREFGGNDALGRAGAAPRRSRSQRATRSDSRHRQHRHQRVLRRPRARARQRQRAFARRDHRIARLDSRRAGSAAVRAHPPQSRVSPAPADGLRRRAVARSAPSAAVRPSTR